MDGTLATVNIFATLTLTNNCRFTKINSRKSTSKCICELNGKFCAKEQAAKARRFNTALWDSLGGGAFTHCNGIAEGTGTTCIGHL